MGIFQLAGGLDALEELQSCPIEDVYRRVIDIMQTYCELEDDTTMLPSNNTELRA